MSALKGHPKGLYLIFATSTAERFSYYGMRAIFILFLTQALLFDKEAAASIYGSYTGLVYLTPLIGGYIADKYWGIRRSVFWGAMMMAVGQFLMFMSASTLDNTELAHWMMYGGLGFLILGKWLFQTYRFFSRRSTLRTGRQTAGCCIYHLLYGSECRFFCRPFDLWLSGRYR